MHGISKLFVFAFGIALIAGLMLAFALATGKVPGPGRRNEGITKQENPVFYWRTVIILAVVTVVFAGLGVWGMHPGRG